MLSYKARRRLSLFLLLVWLPAFVVVAVTVMSTIDKQPIWLEFLIYVVLGLVWAVPFKFVFKGVGKADPNAETNEPPKD
ncbi:MAG: DUF2842 domain-containing protein [Pikeienuella sp.]